MWKSLLETVNTAINKSLKWALVNAVNSKFTTEMISDIKNKKKKRKQSVNNYIKTLPSVEEINAH